MSVSSVRLRWLPCHARAPCQPNRPGTAVCLVQASQKTGRKRAQKGVDEQQSSSAPRSDSRTTTAESAHRAAFLSLAAGPQQQLSSAQINASPSCMPSAWLLCPVRPPFL